MNFCLLAKWWWRLECEDGLWQQLVKAKYLCGKSIHTVTHKANDSPIWYDLLKVKDLYLQGRGINIQNGRDTRFWYDAWLYDKPLYAIVPVLFLLCEQKEVMVAEVKSGSVPIIFRRWLTPELQTCWNLIEMDTNSFQLCQEKDKIFWRFGKNRRFSVKFCIML